jgi:hypothetical protein
MSNASGNVNSNDRSLSGISPPTKSKGLGFTLALGPEDCNAVAMFAIVASIVKNLVNLHLIHLSLVYMKLRSY